MRKLMIIVAAGGILGARDLSNASPRVTLTHYCGVEVGLYDQGTPVPVRQLSPAAVRAYLGQRLGLEEAHLEDPLATLERLFPHLPPRAQFVISATEALDGTRVSLAAVGRVLGVQDASVRSVHFWAHQRLHRVAFHALFGPQDKTILGESLVKLELGVRFETALVKAGYIFIGDLTRASEGELAIVPAMGPSGIQELKEGLGARGLALSTRPWRDPEQGKIPRLLQHSVARLMLDRRVLPTEAWRQDAEARRRLFHAGVETVRELTRLTFSELEAIVGRRDAILYRDCLGDHGLSLRN